MLKRKIPAQIGSLDDRHTVQPVLSSRRYTAALTGQFLESLAGWLVSIALVILAYRLTENIAAVAAIVLTLVVPRLIVQAIPNLRAWRDPSRTFTLLSLARVPLVAGLLLVSARQDLYWAVILMSVIGILTAIADATQFVAVPRAIARRDLGAISLLLGRAEQVAMVAGGITVAALMLFTSERAAFGLAVVVLVTAAGLTAWSRPGPGTAISETERSPADQPPRSPLADVRLLVTGLFAGAVLGMGLRIMLMEIVVGKLDRSEALYALMISIVGIGALLGPPVSIPRLLIRVPGELLTAAGVVALAVAMAFIGVVGSAILIALVLAACGAIAVTNDLIATTLARRIVPVGQVEGTFTALGIAIIAGQIVALMAVIGLSQFWSAGTVTVVISGLCVALVVLSKMTTRPARLRQVASRS